MGFVTGEAGREGIAPALRAFLQSTRAAALNHVFFSWQPRDRGRLRLADYAPAWDDLARALPGHLPRALHHTALNLASLDAPDDRYRGELFEFTNGLCERYGLSWINEDLGFWSLAGRPLPYPLPPVLDGRGLAACVRNVEASRRALVAPLVVEFPGFAEGLSLVLGKMDAYDFFRRVAEETGVAVNLDIAHLLSWRWCRGLRGQALFDDLDRLPLASCYEIHLSGCELRNGRFIDAHHGCLLPEQLQLLRRLLPLCPNLRAVTFEDPLLADDGMLVASSQTSLAALEAATAAWREAPTPAACFPLPTGVAAATAGDLVTPDAAIEHELARLLFDRDARATFARDCAGTPFPELAAEALEETAASVRIMVRQRTHRGTGRLVDLFPRSLERWRAFAPDDAELDELCARFLASPSAIAWREQAGGVPGACLEACFADFLVTGGWAPAAVCEQELLSALLRTLAVTPAPAFVPPPSVRRVPGGWLAVAAASVPPLLFAAVDQRYVHGEITPLAATLLAGASVDQASAQHRVIPAAVATLTERLVEMRLR